MTWPRVFFRLGVVLGTFLAAVAVPDLGALIALLGALTGSILSLATPALINRRCPARKVVGVRRGRDGRPSLVSSEERQALCLGRHLNVRRKRG